MKKMKKLLALLLALVMAASLAACGPCEESDPTGSPAAAALSSLHRPSDW